MFWETFSNLCDKHNIKPNPLAKQLEISSGVLTKWKNGATPNTEALLKISHYFNVSIDYLLGVETASDSSIQAEINQLTEEQKQDVLKYIKFVKSE